MAFPERRPTRATSSGPKGPSDLCVRSGDKRVLRVTTEQRIIGLVHWCNGKSHPRYPDVARKYRGLDTYCFNEFPPKPDTAADSLKTAAQTGCVEGEVRAARSLT